MKLQSGHKRSTFWKWTKRVLVAFAALLLLLVFVVIPYLLAHLITHAGTRPMDLRLTRTPETYGVPYQDVNFLSAGVPRENSGSLQHVARIEGWYLPKEDARGIIIYAHGLFRSRQEVLQRACDFWKAGYAGLLIDLRRHGSSEGDVTSLGYFERLDVLGAVQFLRDSLGWQKPIVGYGVSMGAAATALAAAETPCIDALVIDSSFLSFERTLMHHLKLFFNLPRFPLGDILLFFTRLQAGFRPDDFNVENAVARLEDRPVLVLAGENDRRMPVADERRLYEAAASTHKAFHVIPGAKHGAAWRTHPELYEQIVLDFLDRYLPAQ